MKFNPDEIKEATRADFDTAWNEGRKYISSPGVNEKYPRYALRYGKPHPVFDTIQRLREAYMRLGFEEVMNPIIVEDRDIHKQFGYEALAVLDRCFYTGGLPRPNVGISDERIGKIKSILGDLDDERIERIRQILHSYKKGEIEGDDLVPEMAARLEVSDSRVAVMIDRVFPEFKSIVPVCSQNTLRSHMTSGWFISLGAMCDYRTTPLKLFSVDRCFRREQAEDATRLMAYYSASCVIMDEDVSIEDGKAVASGLLSQFGFSNFNFRPDDKRSKYYVPDTQIEVFAYHPKLVGSRTKYRDGWVEVATFGIYSPSALSQYNIPYPVMNLGMGVERLAMILHDSTDIRALTYPQFQYRINWVMSDSDIAAMVYVDDTPATQTGREIQSAIAMACEQHGDTPSPCGFTAWEGRLFDKNIRVKVVEPEENTKLCGPAAMNEIISYKNDVLGLPRIPRWDDAFRNGVSTGIRYIDAFAARCAREIEDAAQKGSDCEIRVRIIKVPSEINIRLDPVAQLYITGNKKKIDIRGPVFTTVRMEII
ncbi:O-phosphoseryl-tRNA(Cys) synthetase [Candidatus Methanoperedens nitroreducens]|uniref:O-phosphoserine--tRNA(Cys) ligase n=1 Tax=Candidatus Methanoperedens nitratireducens TaxID=1392998 RepID=A0A062V1I9_9EURY|nr:O-phosphoserine--tRNA ligase [Candidatus Methanoperedens nitroreducens]KCZ70483.1 O-phosphoseryl-tRNA(Cys) synthetase [Candidatus Methanoperedens nitroreducens]MDJ1420921.1 O-phosphoserine--tRNA ligase [Candidatus Methanoperedens sp.]